MTSADWSKAAGARVEAEAWPPRWMATGAGAAGRWGLWALLTALIVLWRAARLALCALLVLIEPLVAATLVPLAYLGFLVTVFFGFMMGDPRFPRWGMLGLSFGALCLYWLFIGIMVAVMGDLHGRR